jgi:hypothetical protein
MNSVCSEDFSPHIPPNATTEVVRLRHLHYRRGRSMNSVCSEDFSPHIPPNATTEVVTTNVEVGGAYHV